MIAEQQHEPGSLDHVRALVEKYKKTEAEFARLEESLDLDPYSNYIDPRQASIDSDGTEWGTLGSSSMAGGTNRPAQDFSGFPNAMALQFARETCRRMKTYSPHVISAINKRIYYVIDTGFVLTAVAKKGRKPSADLVAKVQEFLDKWRKINRWFDRQCESMGRRDTDGEVFRRKFRHSDGYLRVRFVEPWQVLNPPGANAQTEFGIETDPEDVETILRYYIAATPDSATAEPVEADEIQHIKANVNMNVRRGVPTFWPVRKEIVRAAKMNWAIAAKIEIAAALTLNRRHASSTTATQASTFSSNQSTFTRSNGVTGRVDQIKKYDPGTVLDSSQNVEYEAFNLAEGIGEMVAGLSSTLRSIATIVDMPEFMFTSDASNGNYSSTMVAEGPVVRSFASLQQVFKEADCELLDEAVEWAIECGVLEPATLEEIEIQVELPELATRDPVQTAQADQIYYQMRIKSPQTISAGIGLEYEQEQTNIADHESKGRAMATNAAAVVPQGGGAPLPNEPDDANDGPQDKDMQAKIGALKGKLKDAMPEEVARLFVEWADRLREAKL